jgi:hypothetical protein
MLQAVLRSSQMQEQGFCFSTVGSAAPCLSGLTPADVVAKGNV